MVRIRKNGLAERILGWVWHGKKICLDCASRVARSQLGRPIFDPTIRCESCGKRLGSW